MNKNIKAKFIADAIEQTFRNRDVEAGLVFYSDRGNQNTSHEVQSILIRLGCKHSMSEMGKCYNNTIANRSSIR
jgi:putative transposase